MKEKFISLFMYLVAGIATGWLAECSLGHLCQNGENIEVGEYNGHFGNWLAAQHAVFNNDFEKASLFLSDLEMVKSKPVQDVRGLVAFLDDGDTSGLAHIKGINSSAAKVVEAAEFAKAGKWKELYARFKNEQSELLAPFRIWGGVGAGEFVRTLKFIDGYPQASNSWRNFSKGAIYAATKNPKTARKFFRKVSVSFMNLGDYHLVMSFYKKYGFSKDADTLRNAWNESPGGMYMSGMELGEDWAAYDSLAKFLAFGLIQNVSHNGEDGLTDAGLLILRAAALLGGPEDSVNYYTGGYFYAAGSNNYKKYWNKLTKNPIYYPFVQMKTAEIAPADRKIKELNRVLRKSPLFMPAIMKVWRESMKNGDESEGMRILDRALRQPGVSNSGIAYLLKLRGHAFYIFGDNVAAEADLTKALDLAPMDAEIMVTLAKVWSRQGKNLDEAYRYAISLVKVFPANVANWDALAMVVAAKDGNKEAKEILERIGAVAEECSELFVHLGNSRAAAGDKAGAADAYRKALALSDDGLVIKADIKRKLEKTRE